MRAVKSVPEELHAYQNKCRGNGISDKVHPMDTLTATVAQIFVIESIIIHLAVLFVSSRMRTISDGVK